MNGNPMPAEWAGKNGGQTNKPFTGSWRDHFAKSVVDPRLDGGTIVLKPRSVRGKRTLERLRTTTGIMPRTPTHGFGKDAKNPAERM